MKLSMLVATTVAGACAGPSRPPLHRPPAHSHADATPQAVPLDPSLSLMPVVVPTAQHGAVPVVSDVHSDPYAQPQRAEDGGHASLPQAFYILFADQVDNADWPIRICQNGGKGPQGSECVPASKYENGLFIASPQNMTKELLDQVRKDVPGSRVVAYWDFGDIPLMGRTTAEVSLPPCRCS